MSDNMQEDSQQRLNNLKKELDNEFKQEQLEYNKEVEKYQNDNKSLLESLENVTSTNN